MFVVYEIIFQQTAHYVCSPFIVGDNSNFSIYNKSLISNDKLHFRVVATYLLSTYKKKITNR